MERRRSFRLEDFEIECEIGQGGFGTVYRAKWKEKDQDVALKKISRQVPKERIESEILALANLKHRRIVEYYGDFVHQGSTYVVMELCEGGSLRSYIKQHGPLSNAQAVHILKQIVLVVTYLHKSNFLHRDLSCGNILISWIDQKGIIRNVKIADFGLATSLQKNENACTVVGTPGYIAPQVYNENYDRKADVYSLGAVLYTMLAGKEPPREGQPRSPYTICESGRALIERMMHPDEKQRIALDKILGEPFMLANSTSVGGEGCSFSTSRDSRLSNATSQQQRYGGHMERQRSQTRENSEPLFNQNRARPVERGQLAPRHPSAPPPLVKRTPPTTPTIEAENGRGLAGISSGSILQARRYAQSGGTTQSSKKDSGFNEASTPNTGTHLLRKSQPESDNWPLRLARLGRRVNMLQKARCTIENSTRVLMEIWNSRGYVTDIMIVSVYGADQTVTIHKPARLDIPKLIEKDDRPVEISNTSEPITYRCLSELPKILRAHYDNLYKVVENHRATSLKIAHRRPPQFPDSEARLMENGDLRVATREDVLVRKSVDGLVYHYANKTFTRAFDRLEISRMNDIYQKLRRIESAWEAAGAEFPFSFTHNITTANRGVNQSNTSSMLQAPSASTSIQSVLPQIRRPFSQQQTLPAQTVRSAPARTHTAMSSGTSASGRAGLTVQWKRDTNDRIFKAVLKETGAMIRRSTTNRNEFVYEDEHKKEFRFTAENVPPLARILFRKFVERLKEEENRNP